MTNHNDQTPDSTPGVRNWPWWEPYAFTAGVFAAFVALLVCLWLVGRHPFAEHVFFVGMTVASICEAARGTSRQPAVLSNLCCLLMATLAAVGYLSQNNQVLGVGYAALAGAWASMTINAVVTRRRLRREASTRLDASVERVRRALGNED